MSAISWKVRARALYSLRGRAGVKQVARLREGERDVEYAGRPINATDVHVVALASAAGRSAGGGGRVRVVGAGREKYSAREMQILVILENTICVCVCVH